MVKSFSIIFLSVLLFLPLAVGAHGEAAVEDAIIGDAIVVADGRMTADEMMGGVWFWPAWLMMLAMMFGYVVWTVVGVLVVVWLWQKVTKKNN